MKNRNILHNDIAFCILNAEKEVYRDHYEAIVSRFRKGGQLIADNAINIEKR